ncbi:GIY-YIG nuclease family protein [Rugamonas sp. A1-17]|nr:GIY-YIG nuclease family protein [Rugamonas sp. A1-17]
MGYIYYQLNHAASLQTMVPPALGGGMFGNAGVPPGMTNFAGIYIIINCNGIHNRYVGISTNIGSRFGPRMSVVTELGFDVPTMANIFVVWGQVKVRNEGLPMGTPTAVTPACFPPPPNIVFPTWAAPGWVVAAPPGAGALNAAVDGNVINLEHLLVRFIMMRLGAGGTVSNNLLMLPFAHPGGGAPSLKIKFHSAAFGPYNGFTVADTLAPGFVF